MRYLFILLLGIGILTALTVASPFGMFDSLKSNVVEAVNPPSEQAKMIDALKEKYQVLDTFLTSTAAKSIPAKDRELLKAAEQVLGDSQELLAELEKKEEQDRPGIIQTLIKKIFTDEQAQPTSIPPNCQLQCKAN